MKKHNKNVPAAAKPRFAIDMASAGVNSNFTAGEFTGPDERLSYPVLVPITPGTTSVQGALSSDSASAFRIEIFGSSMADPSGFGQGQTFLGAASIRTDNNGLASFSVPVSTALTNGEYVTATAIELSTFNTSEFSEAVEVSPAADVGVSISASANPAQARQNLTYTITLTRHEC